MFVEGYLLWVTEYVTPLSLEVTLYSSRPAALLRRLTADFALAIEPASRQSYVTVTPAGMLLRLSVRDTLLTRY